MKSMDSIGTITSHRYGKVLSMEKPNKYRESSLRSTRRIRAERIAAGVCVTCAENPPDTSKRPGCQRCSECNAKALAYQKQLRGKRRADGVCLNCAAPELYQDTRLCKKCQSVVRVRATGYRAKIDAGLGVGQCRRCLVATTENDRRYCTNCLIKTVITRYAKFGITRAWYDAQGGKCAICESTKDLHVDHDHEAGIVRGLLCNFCNHGLGKFKDNADYCLRAARYLNTRKPSNLKLVV